MAHSSQKQQPRRQYFLGGAMWDGIDDQYSNFIRRGFWQLGWGPKDDQYAPIIKQMEQIRPGDRIAIKKRLGQGSSEIQIRAIGVIKDVDFTRGIVYVDWKLTGMKRKVHSRGCYATLHGPYTRQKNDPETTEWLEKIFCL